MGENMKKPVQRIVALLLSICVLFGCATIAISVDVPIKADEQLRLTVTADTHFQSFSDLGAFPSAESSTYCEGMLDSDLYAYAATQGQMNYESYAIVKQLLKSFISNEDDYMLIAGDLTCGKRQSHIEFAQMLRETEQKSHKEIFVVPGNHDCDDDNFDTYISIDEFKEIYADFGYNQALERHEGSGSYTVDLSEKYRLIAIDSCIYGKDEGKIGTSLLFWIRSQAKTARQDGKTLIAMMHHSILPHFSVQPMMDSYSYVARQLADMGIHLVFSGHIHANDISSAKTLTGNPLYDVQTGSLITSPNAFRHVALGDKATITSEYITEIDLADLPDGYSAEQRKYIEQDFPAWAYGYFEAGMCRWLNRYIGSAGKLGKMLKLDPESDLYEQLDALLRIVGNAINLPIYDDGSTPNELDSIEEIAKSAGYTLPESDYERVYQIVAALMGNFYRGDDNEQNLDDEKDLLFDCIKAALAHGSVNLLCDGLLDYILQFLNIDISRDLFISRIAKRNYSQNISSALTDAIFTPLLEGISCDFSETSDIQAVIDFGAYSASVENRAPIHFWEPFLRYFYDFFSTLHKCFGFAIQ